MDKVVETIQIPTIGQNNKELDTDKEKDKLQFIDKESNTIPVTDQNNYLDTWKTPETSLIDSSNKSTACMLSNNSIYTVEG